MGTNTTRQSKDAFELRKKHLDLFAQLVQTEVLPGKN